MQNMHAYMQSSVSHICDHMSDSFKKMQNYEDAVYNDSDDIVGGLY